MSYTEGDPMSGAGLDPHALAHPQELYAGLRHAGSVMMIDGHALVASDEAVRHVLQHPDDLLVGYRRGAHRPGPTAHPAADRSTRAQELPASILDPLFAPKQVALLEASTRDLVREYIAAVADQGGCNFHEAVAEPLPTTVFLRCSVCPSRALQEFLVLKDGIIRPDTTDPDERIRMVDATGAKIYAILQEVLDERVQEPQRRLHVALPRGRRRRPHA